VNIHTVTVTKTSQVRQGDVYRISGTSNGLPLPPQLFRVETPILRSCTVGRPYVRGAFAYNLGVGRFCSRNAVLWLDSVGVYDTGYGTDLSWWYAMIGQQDHDRHLERVVDDPKGQFYQLLRNLNYQEILTA